MKEMMERYNKSSCRQMHETMEYFSSGTSGAGMTGDSESQMQITGTESTEFNPRSKSHQHELESHHLSMGAQKEATDFRVGKDDWYLCEGLL